MKASKADEADPWLMTGARWNELTGGKAGIGEPMYCHGASGPGSATGPKARAISSALGC